MNRLKTLVGFRQKKEEKSLIGYYPARHVRQKPGQEVEHRNNILGVPVPRMQESLLTFAINPWMFTAVNYFTEVCALSGIMVKDRYSNEEKGGHRLLDLLSKYGKPNDADDVVEFMERHYSNFLLVRNSYWWWHSRFGGEPDSVYHLDPRMMRVVPGGFRRVSHYEYRVSGEVFKLLPETVTHFKAYHPFNDYHGMPIYEPGRKDFDADREMARWNSDYFDGPSIPQGVFVVPKETTADQITEFQEDMEQKHRGMRRTAVVRGEPGAVSWLDAGLRHTDLQFIEGRKLTRQVVYEMLGLPLGLLSEKSTEAHARIAERQFLHRCWRLQRRTASKLTVDALSFYSDFLNTYVEYEDVRVADWAQELAKWNSYKIRVELGQDVPEGSDY